MPSLTKKHKDQLQKMYKKFCERNKLNPENPSVARAFRSGYRIGHRVARTRACNG